ncbi:hypothetical protein B0H16DRAFT_1476849 [Mycena metata]|uniref:Uncharacterized protein n=1 Tax=Mycena metata TaxID=1033252 RepID=A0AAD7HAV9_9AGAR|nr:hypothetical protein B0H16DRAFT_1476849 [Mycena metata]
MSGNNPRPRRQPAIILYSELHYATRVKPQFDERWNSIKETTQPGECIAMSQDFMRTCWEEESQELRNDIEKQAAKAHTAAVAKWKTARVSSASSAEEYHQALTTLNEVGIPLADALSGHLGMHVVILAVGPAGVFSDTESGATSKTWPQFDHVGYTAMEKSITRYGRGFFNRPPQGNTPTALPPAPVPLAAPPQGNAPMPLPLTSVPPATNTPTPPRDVSVAPPVNDSGTDLVEEEETAAGAGDGIDREEWTETLILAHKYLMGKPWGPSRSSNI